MQIVRKGYRKEQQHKRTEKRNSLSCRAHRIASLLGFPETDPPRAKCGD